MILGLAWCPTQQRACNTKLSRFESIPMLGRFPVKLGRVVHAGKGDVIEFWMFGVIVTKQRRATVFARAAVAVRRGMESVHGVSALGNLCAHAGGCPADARARVHRCVCARARVGVRTCICACVRACVRACAGTLT